MAIARNLAKSVAFAESGRVVWGVIVLLVVAFCMAPRAYGGTGDTSKSADDCFVVMNRGDELTLRVPAAKFASTASGFRRSFILKADCYTKDMDLMTAASNTVAPLPFHAMHRYPYGPDEHYPNTTKTRAYRRRYNTRSSANVAQQH